MGRALSTGPWSWAFGLDFLPESFIFKARAAKGRLLFCRSGSDRFVPRGDHQGSLGLPGCSFIVAFDRRIDEWADKEDSQSEAEAGGK